MIFISGVHGVGKSHFSNRVKEALGLETFSASTLIADLKKAGFSTSKFIPDIDENQQYLIEALRPLSDGNSEFLLDGHFCLLDGDGTITRIPKDTYTALNPIAIVLLTERPETIAARRKNRDKIDVSVPDIRNFQNAEIEYAEEVTSELDIPLHIMSGAKGESDALEFIQTLMRRASNER